MPTTLKGVWTSNDVCLTFTGDSLYVDEINNEGFGYKYTVSDDIITATSTVLGYPTVMSMEIMDITPTTLSLRWLDSDTDTVFEYKRKLEE